MSKAASYMCGSFKTTKSLIVVTQAFYHYNNVTTVAFFCKNLVGLGYFLLVAINKGIQYNYFLTSHSLSRKTNKI